MYMYFSSTFTVRVLCTHAPRSLPSNRIEKVLRFLYLRAYTTVHIQYRAAHADFFFVHCLDLSANTLTYYVRRTSTPFVGCKSFR